MSPRFDPGPRECAMAAPMAICLPNVGMIALAIAESLLPDDGYAAVARPFIQASMGNTDQAATVYREQVQPMAQSNIGNPVPAPSNYVAVLAAEFDVADKAYCRHDFAWPDGERLGPGWNSSQAPGSGITVSVQGQRLRFQGSADARRPGLARHGVACESLNLNG